MISDKKKASHARYLKATWDSVTLRVPIGYKDTIASHAVARGESVNGLIVRAIQETITRKSGDADEMQAAADRARAAAELAGDL